MVIKYPSVEVIFNSNGLINLKPTSCINPEKFAANGLLDFNRENSLQSFFEL